VNFTHFVKITKSIKIKYLHKYLERGIAIICKNREEGIDIIIPIAIAHEGFNLNLFDTNSYSVSCLFDQVKTRNQNINIDEIVEKMFTNELILEFRDNNILNSSIFMVHNVSGHGATIETVPFKLYNSKKIIASIQNKLSKKKKVNEQSCLDIENVERKTLKRRNLSTADFEPLKKDEIEPFSVPSDDVLVLLLFGVGEDFEDFKIPCLEKKVTDVLKEMRLVQPVFEGNL
jgi:hypothetical protein